MGEHQPPPGTGTGRSPVDHRFPPEARLHHSREFRQATARGRKSTTALLVLYVLPRSGGETRLGITASRKVGKAVVRNRIKRTVRESFRHHRGGQGERALRRGCDYLVIARPAAGQAPPEQLRDQLVRLFGPYMDAQS